jgi:hypothetical protein
LREPQIIKEVKNMLTKKSLVNLAILLIAGTAFLGAVCFAAEQTPGVEQPKTTKVQGTVNVTKDPNDPNVITSITLVTAEKVTYHVRLNAKGLELGKEMAGKEVEVEGIVTKVGEKEWIRVLSFKPVEKAP